MTGKKACAKKLLVLGIGSYLCGDDAVGFLLSEKLSDSFADPRVDVISGGTTGLGLLYLLEGYSDVIVLDAVDVGAEPGTVFQFSLEDLECLAREKNISLHQGGPSSLFRYGKLLSVAPDNVIVLGIQVKTVNHEIGLSGEIEEKLEVLESKIKDFIEHYIAQCMS